MLLKLKSLLNNSVVWLIALLGAVLFFWKKERDLARELEAEKASGAIKELEGEKRKVDEKASSDLKRFNDLVDAYDRAHRGQSVQGDNRGSKDSDRGPAGSDSGSGPHD